MKVVLQSPLFEGMSADKANMKGLDLNILVPAPSSKILVWDAIRKTSTVSVGNSGVTSCVDDLE